MTSLDEQLDELARAAYVSTRDGMGFTRPEWDELSEQTKQHYRNEVIRRLVAQELLRRPG